MSTDSETFDAIMRLQVYMEGYKNSRDTSLDAAMSRVARELRGILAQVEEERLSDLTRKEVRDLMARVDAAQSAIYDDLADTELAEYDDASFEIGLLISGALIAITGKGKPPPRNPGGQTFTGSQLGVSGLTPRELFERYVQTAKRDLLDLLNKGYADKLTKQEILRSIVGTKSRNYLDGLLNRNFNRGLTTVRTTLQWLKVRAVHTAIKGVSDRYRWVSIMDAVTTEICQGRHNNIYTVGKGPLPPAHFNCRSGITPYFGSNDYNPPNFRDWYSAQPEAVQKELLGTRLRTKVLAGTVDIRRVSTQVPKLTKAKLLSKKLH